MALVTAAGHGMGYRREDAAVATTQAFTPTAGVRAQDGVDLRPQLAAVRDQGSLGCCTAMAATGAAYHTYKRDGEPHPTIGSALFVYYNERREDGTVARDAGGSGRLVIASLAKYGNTAEAHWPYDVARYRELPPAAAYADARLHRATDFFALAHDVAHAESCLAEGYTFILAVPVYQTAFGAAPWGNVALPGHDDVLEGWHEILVCGFDRARQVFHFQNSWGTLWGTNGYGTLPYAYLTTPDLSYDPWTIRVQR